MYSGLNLFFIALAVLVFIIIIFFLLGHA